MKNKDKLKQEVEKIEKSSDTVKEYIQAFNKAFDKVNYSNKDTNILENLYRNFIDQAYKPTAVVQFLVDRIVEVESKLKSKFNEEEKKLFDEFARENLKITDSICLKIAYALMVIAALACVFADFSGIIAGYFVVGGILLLTIVRAVMFAVIDKKGM